MPGYSTASRLGKIARLEGRSKSGAASVDSEGTITASDEIVGTPRSDGCAGSSPGLFGLDGTSPLSSSGRVGWAGFLRGVIFADLMPFGGFGSALADARRGREGVIPRLRLRLAGARRAIPALAAAAASAG